MEYPLSLTAVKELVEKAEMSFRHEECRTCECYQGYIVQIMIDADPEAREYINGYTPPKDQIHACLGCDPCPPGILYANYLRKQNK